MSIVRAAVLAAIVAGSAVASSAASAQQSQWVPLGCRDVGFQVDRDVIQVGGREGRFRSIRLKVAGNPVHMLDLKVVYPGGATDDIQIRALIRAGETTRGLDLRGYEQPIGRIEMIYRAQPNFRGRASVCVEGLRDVAMPVRPPPQWVLFGCREVGFQVDRDVLRVPQQRSNFSAIRLKVAGNTINMYDLKVVYQNGQVHDISVRAEIRDGATTVPFDLIGRERGIDRIEMVYQSRPDFRGQATICVEGLD